ncbi:MAG: F0F1 ATP synthase subunit A [Clostridia bacterium]|nr:F0F1 ATP synthase subunit A [Clostridia bacterium]
MIIIPIVCLILLRVLVYPVSEGINVTGALIYFTIPMPIQDFPVTESQVNSLAVLVMLFGLCLYLTHGIRKNVNVKRTVLAEWIVEKVEGLVKDNMGEFFSTFGPFIAAVMGLSGFSSLLALFGLYAPTSDINIVGGWAILVFFLITYYKAICGPVQYLKSFTEPVALLTPINLISEIATPISMAFRHYGNVLSGSVISVLLAAGLQGLSAMVLGWLPGFLGEIPLFRVGIPAVLSIYFDIFSGCLQAFIFATLTMMYVSSGFPQDEYEKRRLKKAQKS